jgi:hypothetical protein
MGSRYTPEIVADTPRTTCSARNAISSIMLCAWPQSADPMRKIMIDA